jgi:hypothetical protein
MRQLAAFCHEEGVHPPHATTLSLVRFSAVNISFATTNGSR